MLHCSSSLRSKIYLKCDTTVNLVCLGNNANHIKPKRKQKRTEKRGWKHLTIFTKCKEASGTMASSPEGEFHGTKGRQKKNRAKSIRECNKESS